ncbi:MAG: hypothetical protein H6Q14_2642 [Bacteroidetes bacterium]|nr:hypothetical protein [Bacteroidota bacterium]
MRDIVPCSYAIVMEAVWSFFLEIKYYLTSNSEER